VYGRLVDRGRLPPDLARVRSRGLAKPDDDILIFGMKKLIFTDTVTPKLIKLEEYPTIVHTREVNTLFLSNQTMLSACSAVIFTSFYMDFTATVHGFPDAVMMTYGCLVVIRCTSIERYSFKSICGREGG
jgi:hypothetical protein